MEVNYVIEKLKTKYNLSDFSGYTEDIQKLVRAHNNNEINLYPKIRLLSEQISLGLDNPYERIVETLKHGKDSSSLIIHKIKYGDDEGLKRFTEKKSKCAHTLDKYIKKYGELNGPVEYKKYCKSKSMSLEMCINRHGKEVGSQVFEQYWKTTGFGTSKRAFKKRHGEQWEEYYNNFIKQQGKNNTLEGKIEKYGEELGTKIYNEVNLKKSKSSNKDAYIKKLLEKGVPFNEIQLYVRDRWDNTSLKSFISRYGEHYGPVKYYEFIEKVKLSNPLCIEYYLSKGISEDNAFEIISKIQWRYNKNNCKVSKESLKYLDTLNEFFIARGVKCTYKNEEFGIKLTKDEFSVYKKNRCFFYDFYVPSLNLIIEYHGERFHDDIDYNSTIGVNESELKNIEYNKDFYKKWLAENRGNTVIILRSWRITEDLNYMFNYLNFTEDEKCKFL